MAKYYLLTFKANYADEFDVEGMRILTEREYKNLQQVIKESKEIEKHKILDESDFGYNYSICFGTNYDLDFRDIDDMVRKIKTKEITAEQYNAFKAVDMSSFGETCVIDLFYDERIFEELNFKDDKECNSRSM